MSALPSRGGLGRGRGGNKKNRYKMSYRENLFYGASPEIQKRAAELRKNMTRCEKLLWDCLKNKSIQRHKFRRQHPIDKYIVDFYCHQLKLIIEVDGGIHNEIDNVEYDKNRTFELEEYGLEVLRFTNEHICNHMEDVLMTIRKKIEHHLL